jgi:hypothetical protein
MSALRNVRALVPGEGGLCQQRALRGDGRRLRTLKGETDRQVERLGALDDEIDERLQSAGVPLVDCKERQRQPRSEGAARREGDTQLNSKNIVHSLSVSGFMMAPILGRSLSFVVRRRAATISTQRRAWTRGENARRQPGPECLPRLALPVLDAADKARDDLGDRPLLVPVRVGLGEERVDLAADHLERLVAKDLTKALDEVDGVAAQVLSGRQKGGRDQGRFESRIRGCCGPTLRVSSWA